MFFYPTVSVGGKGWVLFVCLCVLFYPSAWNDGELYSICLLSVFVFFYPSVFVFFYPTVSVGGEGVGSVRLSLCPFLPFSLKRRLVLQYLSTCLSSSFSTRLSSCFSTRLSLLGGGGGAGGGGGFCSSVCVSFSTLQSGTTAGSTVSVYCLSSSFSTRLSLLGGRGGICSSVSVSFSTLQSGTTVGSTVSVYCLSSSFSTRLSLLGGRGGICSSVSVSFSTLQSETTVGSTCLSTVCLRLFLRDCLCWGEGVGSVRLSLCVLFYPSVWNDGGFYSICLLSVFVFFYATVSVGGAGGGGGRGGICSSVSVSFSTLQSETTVGSTVSVYCLSSSFSTRLSSSFSTRLSSSFSTRLSLLGGGGGEGAVSVSLSLCPFLPFSLKRRRVLQYLSTVCLRLFLRDCLCWGEGVVSVRLSLCLFYPSVWNDGGFYSICLLSVFVFFYATVSVGGAGGGGGRGGICSSVSVSFSTLQSETTVGSTVSVYCLSSSFSTRLSSSFSTRLSSSFSTRLSLLGGGGGGKGRYLLVCLCVLFYPSV